MEQFFRICRLIKNERQIELELAWLKRLEVSHSGIIRMVNSHGKVVFHDAENDDLFQLAGIGESFVDVIRLKPHKMSLALQIELSLKGRGKKRLPIDAGPVARTNRTLLIATKNEIESVPR